MDEDLERKAAEIAEQAQRLFSAGDKRGALKLARTMAENVNGKPNPMLNTRAFLEMAKTDIAKFAFTLVETLRKRDQSMLDYIEGRVDE